MKAKMHKAVLAVVCCAGTAGMVRADSLFNYNVVVTGTLTDSSHIQGRTFVDNLAVSNQPDFAQSTAAGTGDTLDVAGTVTGNGLTLERGVFRHAGALGFTPVLNGGSTSVQDSSVSISSLSNQMNSIASLYNSYSATTVTPSGGNLNINATGTGVAVFSVNASDLSNSNENVSVNVGTASSVIIQVLGSSFTFGSSEHESITGSSQQVIWDFVNATMIHLNDSTWNGSILDPLATLTSPNQNIDGGVYVANFNQSAEVHLPTDGNGNPVTPAFNGPVPVPAPGILVGVLALAFGVVSMRGIRLVNSAIR
jgi:choice-of-anchor A domain-containing protein